MYLIDYRMYIPTLIAAPLVSGLLVAGPDYRLFGSQSNFIFIKNTVDTEALRGDI